MRGERGGYNGRQKAAYPFSRFGTFDRLYSLSIGKWPWRNVRCGPKGDQGDFAQLRGALSRCPLGARRALGTSTAGCGRCGAQVADSLGPNRTCEIVSVWAGPSGF